MVRGRESRGASGSRLFGDFDNCVVRGRESRGASGGGQDVVAPAAVVRGRESRARPADLFDKGEPESGRGRESRGASGFRFLLVVAILWSAAGNRGARPAHIAESFKRTCGPRPGIARPASTRSRRCSVWWSAAGNRGARPAPPSQQIAKQQLTAQIHPGKRRSHAIAQPEGRAFPRKSRSCRRAKAAALANRPRPIRSVSARWAEARGPTRPQPLVPGAVRRGL